MLAAIKTFFQQHLDSETSPATSAEQRTRLAAAALFIEVLRADGDFAESERAVLLKTLADRFQVSAAEAGELLALADASAKEAIDLYQFTSEINRHFSAEKNCY